MSAPRADDGGDGDLRGQRHGEAQHTRALQPGQSAVRSQGVRCLDITTFSLLRGENDDMIDDERE